LAEEINRHAREKFSVLAKDGREQEKEEAIQRKRSEKWVREGKE